DRERLRDRSLAGQCRHARARGGDAPRRPRHRRDPRPMKKLPAGIPWIAPAVGLLLALSIYPLLYSVKVSLGGGNYVRLFQDRLFSVSCAQTALYASVALTAEFLLGLGLALLVDSLARGRSFFRAGLLVPMLLPPVVAAVIWRLIYNPQFGVLNGTLRAAGFRT